MTLWLELMLWSHADVDECLEAALRATDLCADDANSQCVNTEGSFVCVCVPGYEEVNGTCARKQPMSYGIDVNFSSAVGVLNELPPPLPAVVTPTSGADNSINFTAPTLTPETVGYDFTISNNIIVTLTFSCI